MAKDTMIGVDLAKNSFQIHAATLNGEVKFRRKLTRTQFLSFMAAQPPAVVVMEACGGAHHWARELAPPEGHSALARECVLLSHGMTPEQAARAAQEAAR